ncbi:hypothetical protein VitviT2T_021816 [Vitis vinifera]|uniref:Rx N-terminal domain-containing protein n=1 Tax=Vitis vinifera TaxID=29760 RepID=A0ABY9D834_VITVI|nr:hypothetical protein VitviT2T_021816 [Vitis vinifera]
MAASVVTLFQWRLNSMLLQENEILLGVKDQIESLINKLDAVGSFTGDVDRILGRDSYHPTWASELRGMLCEAEDFVDDFVIKVFGQTEKDREDSIAKFGNELQNINSRVSEILNRRPRLEASLMLEEIHRFVRSNFVFDEDKETALASCMLNYINLPYDLKLSLLFYCAFLGRYGRTKGALVQVLVAADSIIPPTARHVSIHDAENTITNMNSLVHSLFVSEKEGLSEASSDCLETVLYNAKRVRVLGLEKTQLKSLPDVVGKLVNLRHLSVRQSKINELPESISNLGNLQTMDISWSGNEFELSNGVLNLAQQRHLKMFRPRNAGEVRVPRGISRLRNLQTLEGIYAGGGIAKELGNMTQLRSLEVRSVSEDHAGELYAFSYCGGGEGLTQLQQLTSVREFAFPLLRILLTSTITSKTYANRAFNQDACLAWLNGEPHQVIYVLLSSF